MRGGRGCLRQLVGSTEGKHDPGGAVLGCRHGPGDATTEVPLLLNFCCVPPGGCVRFACHLMRMWDLV